MCFINNNILIEGQKNFKKGDINSHRIASTILKISDELGIHNEKETKKEDLIKSLIRNKDSNINDNSENI